MPGKRRATTRETVEKVAEETGVPPDVLGGVVLWGTVAYDQEQATAAQVTETAERLRAVHGTWEGKTDADPWDVAVAAQDDEGAATRWAESGRPQYDPDRSIPISEYVRRTRSAW